MPFRYRIDRQLGIVVTRAEGEVSREDLLDHAQALLGDPEVQGMNELVDLIGRSRIDTPPGAVRETAQLLRDRALNQPGGRLALVADSDAVFGMARLYQAHREHPDIEIGVFRDRRKALDWLGVPRPESYVAD